MPSLWTEPCEQSSGAVWPRGPFKSHEPETLRNPRAIHLQSSVSPGGSCRARPAAVHRPSLSTGDESLAPRSFPYAGSSALPVPPRQPLGCCPCRRGTGSARSPGRASLLGRGSLRGATPALRSAAAQGRHRLISCARGGREAGRLFPLTHPRRVFLL